MKKILLISGGILLVVVLGIFSWILISKDPETPVSETLKNFLPFGSGDDFNEPVGGGSLGGGAEGNGETGGGESGEAPAEILFKVADSPVAGFVTLNRGTSSTVVRYAERATGNIYDVNLETLEKTRLTNQTLPKIYETYFRGDGSVALFRSLKDDSDIIENISLALTPPKAAATTSPDGSFYTASSTALRGSLGVVAASGNTLYYVLNDARSIVSSAFDGSGQKTLFSSAFTEWILRPYGSNLLIQTKAGRGVQGYAYSLTGAGGFSKLLGPLSELTALMNQDGSRLLYSYRDGALSRLFIKNIKTGETLEVAASTFAEKCVWSKLKSTIVFCGMPTYDIGQGLPDTWFRGETSFQDRVWSIDAETEVTQLLAEPIRILGFDLDVIKPALSPREDYFVFINKNDLSLWALKIEPLEE